MGENLQQLPGVQILRRPISDARRVSGVAKDILIERLDQRRRGRRVGVHAPMVEEFLRIGEGGAQPADTSESATGADGKKEDVVDAEFTEVDDDKNSKKSA